MRSSRAWNCLLLRQSCRGQGNPLGAGRGSKVACPLVEWDTSKSHSAVRDRPACGLGQTKSAVMNRLPVQLIVQCLLPDEVMLVAIPLFPRQIAQWSGTGNIPQT